MVVVGVLVVVVGKKNEGHEVASAMEVAVASEGASFLASRALGVARLASFAAVAASENYGHS